MRVRRAALAFALLVLPPELAAAQASWSELSPRDRVWNEARRFYARRGTSLAWVEGGRLNERYAALLRALGNARGHGLDPEAYRFTALRALAARPVEARDARPLCRELDYALLSYASSLLGGQLDPREIRPDWTPSRRPRDLARLLDAALASGRLESVLDELAPRQAGYRQLAAALGRYREIASRGGWPVLALPAPGRRVSGREKELLARRLAAEGDLAPTGWERTGSDADLAEALRGFQRRHGLRDHGAFDARTLAALNVPARERVRQIELNLERWRWLPDEFGRRYLLVNIPAFRLEAIEDGRVRLSMRAVVGRASEPTPVLSDEMTQVVFSPYWNVPERIAREEVLPALREDPDYLESQNLQLIRVGARPPRRTLDPASGSMEGFAFRQRPGSGNVMGDVKFALPNRFDVYLHDTPDAASFYAERPAFSHGCVRVERPDALARYVLRGSGFWTPQRIRAAMSSGRERAVALSAPLPVHLVYWTAFVDEHGAVNFRDDVYGYDATQAGALAELRGERAKPPGDGSTGPTLVRSSGHQPASGGRPL